MIHITRICVYIYTCNVMEWSAMLCYVMICYDMLLYVKVGYGKVWYGM